jgi:ADP-ribose pyrophosphatase YjhB (NUDIX family)
MANSFRCVIHGSFSKHFAEIKKTAEIFAAAGIEVLAPKQGELVASKDGFALFADEADQDPRLVELLYLHNLKRLGENGFSYFVNPDGYIGKSASYELGIAQLTNTRCFFSHTLSDHPAYVHKHAIWRADMLADYILTHDELPLPQVRQNDKNIHKLWEDLMVPGSVVATGAIIEHQPRTNRREKEILLVKTHKWGDRYSIVGGKVRRNERLQQALLREVKEETMLNGEVGAHICTFDQIKNSGYYQGGVQHIFVDNIVTVKSKKVSLNDEAQDYIWALPSEALQHLDIEPNARTTVELYHKQLQAVRR